MASELQDPQLSRFFAVPGEDTEPSSCADESNEWLKRVIEAHAASGTAPAFGRAADPAGYKPLTTFKEDTFHKHDHLFVDSVKDAGIQAHLQEMAAEQPAYQQKLPWAGGAEQEDSFWAFAARSEATSDLFGVLRNRFISVNAPAYQQLQLPLSLPQLPYATWPLTASEELNIVARAAQHPQIRPVPPPPLHTDDDAYSYKAASSQYRGEQQYQAVTAPASPALIDSAAVIFGLPDAEQQQQQQQQPLLPLAWERPEARHWRSQPPPLPRLLQSFLRVTQEGGTALFSTVYSEGFAAAPEHSTQQSSTTAQLVQDALAALQGIGSASFVYSSASQTMLPARLPAQPAHALSRGAARSLLTEIAGAGTHYCRLEAVAAQCSSGAGGPVQRAFGEALQRQLVLLQAAVQALQNGAVHPPKPPPPTLLQLVLKSEPLRRLLACLAEVCMCGDSTNSCSSNSGGATSLPRGAALLSYLHQCVCSLDSAAGMGLSAVTSSTTTSTSSSSSSSSSNSAAAAVGLHRRKAVLALLRAACAPWLAMLSKWLWSGDLLEADDPYHEFPVNCKGSTSSSSSSSSSSDGSGLASWMTDDGGAAFMQHGFTYSSSTSSSSSSVAAVAPAFLSPAVLARALSAGKALRMLLLASSDFHTAARATHPPPLGLVFSSSALTARRAVLQRLQRMQGAAAAALAAELRARRARASSAAAVARRARGAGAAEDRRAVLAAEAEWRRAKVAVLQQRREWAQVTNS
jgi:Gamma tubulin complex component N-terminal